MSPQEIADKLTEAQRGIRPADFTDEYRANVCKIGQGAECCRYLTCGADGFECAKHTDLAWAIDHRADQMNAKGDNCDGVYELRQPYRLLRDAPQLPTHVSANGAQDAIIISDPTIELHAALSCIEGMIEERKSASPEQGEGM